SAGLNLSFPSHAATAPLTIELMPLIDSRAIIMGTVNVIAFSTAAYSGQPWRRPKSTTITRIHHVTTPAPAPAIVFNMIYPLNSHLTAFARGVSESMAVFWRAGEGQAP